MLRFAAFLLLQAGDTQHLNPAMRGLQYLARHQSPDGSWGGVSPRCSCHLVELDTPLAIILDAPTKAKARALVAEFENPEIERRIVAGEDLVRMGVRAVPALQEGLGGMDSETALRCRAVLEKLWRADRDVHALLRKAAAPRLGPDVEATALALLCFLSAGYCPFSRDEFLDPINHEAVRFGEVVRKGLTWLTGRLEGEGAAKERDPAASVIASLALLEVYGVTGNPIWKEQAQRVCDVLLKERSEDVRTCAWKAMALMSALGSKLEGPIKSELDRLEEWLSKKDGPLARSAAFILRRRGKTTDDGALAGDLKTLGPADLGPEELLFVTLGRYHSGGPESFAWRIWQEPLKAHLFTGRAPSPSHCEYGSWEGADETIETCALKTLSFLAYYRYSNHFGFRPRD